MVGSRILGKWGNNNNADFYYKAYVKTIGQRMWEIELEDNRDHANPYKQIPHNTNFPFVLDVPPKHSELRVGTRVLAPWERKFYAGTIIAARDSSNRYKVRADDNDEKLVTIDQIRLLKTPTFCN